MTAYPSQGKATPTSNTGRRMVWAVAATTFRLLGRIVHGTLATILLSALVAGLPWALARFVGWPLPNHVPSWDELQVVLLTPMTPEFLLDGLAVLCWIVWFFFVLDVLVCAIDVARGIRWPEVRSPGPLRGLAAGLIGTIVLTLLGNRAATASTITVTALPGDPSLVAVMAPLDPGPPPQATTQQPSKMTVNWAAPAPPGMVQVIDEVRLPHTEGETVVYDSLWRVAERMFGDGNRWPELFAQNRGVVQADGRTLTQPHLVRPGWKITGLIPTPVQTPEQSPQPSDERPPVTPSQPPKTTTQPAPSSTQAPTADNTDHSGEQAPTRQPGLDLQTGTFVSVLLAGMVTAAVVSTRMWRRRR